jgi:hypothetical protein
MKIGDTFIIYYCEDCMDYMSGLMFGLHNPDHIVRELKVQVIE